MGAAAQQHRSEKQARPHGLLPLGKPAETLASGHRVEGLHSSRVAVRLEAAVQSCAVWERVVVAVKGRQAGRQDERVSLLWS